MSPIVAADWSLSYPRFMPSTEKFYLNITIAPNVSLPTKPVLKIYNLIGDQRNDSILDIDSSSPVTFFIANDLIFDPDCTIANNPSCITELKTELEDVGLDGNVISGMNGEINPQFGEAIILGIPMFNMAGSHGFSIDFKNTISDVKKFNNNGSAIPETIQLLDPLPDGSGNWVALAVTNWDFHWVLLR